MPRSNVEEDMAAQPPYIYRPYHRRAMKTRIFNGLGLGIDPDKYVDLGQQFLIQMFQRVLLCKFSLLY